MLRKVVMKNCSVAVSLNSNLILKHLLHGTLNIIDERRVKAKKALVH